jgi:magnesium transporter
MPPLLRADETGQKGKKTYDTRHQGARVSNPKAKHSLIRILAYGPQEFTEGYLDNPHLVAQFPHAWPVTWVSVQGLGDLPTLTYLGELFGLHPLALEDIVSSRQRVKVDEYEGHLFVVAKMIKFQSQALQMEQINIFIGENFILTFQEHETDTFDSVREKVRRGQQAVRKQGADYLAYVLLDTIIDHYFPVLDHFGEILERLEEQSLQGSSENTVPQIHKLRHELLSIRRSVWPMREVLHFLGREGSTFFKAETKIYLRDCYDHANQITDLVENYRDLASGVVDVSLASSNNRLNEIMKVLTMISTIFIPLGFVASIYGMNFDASKSPWNMPETQWYWGYPFALGLMLLMTLTMLLFFRQKAWIGSKPIRKAKVQKPQNEAF